MTVVARRFAARPVRTASVTWQAISDMIACGCEEAASQFRKVEGTAAALIAEEALRSSPLVVIGSGPRLRVYCIYDEDAVAGDDWNEDALSWSPTQSDWKAYLPTPISEMEWVSTALIERSSHFIAYDPEKGISESEDPGSKLVNLTIDVERFRNL